MYSEKIAYLAGLFDGEGTCSIQVNIRETNERKDGTKNGVKSVHFNPRMSMSLKYGKEVLQEFVEIFGGTIYEYPETGDYRWFLGKKVEEEKAIKTLLPYLRIKKRIAERFIEALETFPTTRGNRYNGERSWTEEMVNKVAYIALTLNPESARKSPKSIQYLEELKQMYEGDS
jgi:hypothetical protein